jgi:outer membrane protein OmpA-like peptidoglycan-associated protein
MTPVTPSRTRRARTFVLLGGGLALAGLYVVGAAVVEPQIEDDLSARVPAALAAQGYSVSADFSGQDGTLRCAAPLGDPAAARQVALDVYGVRAITLDASCGVDGATPVDATTVPTTVPATTVPATTVVATTVVASTSTTTIPATTTTVAVEPQFAVQWVSGTLVVGGTVNSDLVKLAVFDRVRSLVAAGNVVDQLAVDTAAGEVPAQQLTAMLNLVALMPTSLTEGRVAWDGAAIVGSGSYLDDVGRATFQSAADAVAASVTLAPRPTATAEQAAALEAELNTLVAAQPILFDKGSTDISAASQATVQRIAGIAKRYAGVHIEVQGHTDSEGDPAKNLTLSEQRAGAVLNALVALGVPAADLSATGFGMTQLIRDEAGNELPEQSRRVVFGVVTT